MPRFTLRRVAVTAYATFIIVLAAATLAEWRRGSLFVAGFVYG